MSIWLDVTTIWGWRRPAAGIVRMEAEVARYFMQMEDPSIKFCRYDDAARSYLVVPSEEASNILQGLDGGWSAYSAIEQSSAHTMAVTREVEGQRRPRWDLWRVRGKRAIERLPRGGVWRCARRMHRACMGLSEHVCGIVFKNGNALRPNGAAKSVDYVPCKLSAPRRSPFKTGDVYVSLGLDWDQKDLAFLYELKNRLGVRVILCCYDIIPILMPEMCVRGVPEKFPRYFVDVAWCADEVVCISECSLRDLRGYLKAVGAPVPRMEVIKLGSQLAVDQETSVALNVEPILKQPFILYVSTIEARKNHVVLYQAYKKMMCDGSADIPMLVWVGMPGWGVEELLADVNNDSELRQHIRVLNFVSDDDLSRLYRASLFTVYPSLYEGWGLPVGESLAYGKFCLASNAASIPEVGGHLIEYLDPHDIDAWASRLQWYIKNPDEIKNRESKIAASYQSPSWCETGKSILSSARRLENYQAMHKSDLGQPRGGEAGAVLRQTMKL